MDIGIKYIAWVLSIGIPFCGAWLFNYTTKEEGTDRKRITFPGKVAFAFTILSIALALVITIRADIKNTRSEVARTEAAANELAYREKTDQLLVNTSEHLSEILSILEKDANRLDSDDIEKLSELFDDSNHTIHSSLQSILDEYPRLIAKIDAFDKVVRHENKNSTRDGNTDIINEQVTSHARYTQEQFEEGLRMHETILLREYGKLVNRSNSLTKEEIDERELFEIELSAISAKLADIEPAYAEVNFNLNNLLETNKELEGLVSTTQLEATAKAIVLGPAAVYEAYNSIVDNASESIGDTIAKVAFQAAQLAESAVMYPEALKLYRKAATLEDKNTVYADGLAKLHLLMNRGAADSTSDAVNKELLLPKSPTTYELPTYHLGANKNCTSFGANGSGFKPTKPIDFVIMAGAGGGADQIARFIQSVAEKKKLTPHPLIPINKGGGSGAEALIAMNGSKDPDHTILVTLNSFFTTPLRQKGLGIDISTFTPIAMMGVDPFVLWVHKERGINTFEEWQAAVKEADGEWVMGGTDKGQEDSFVTTWLEQNYDMKIKYIPYKNGLAVAKDLARQQIMSSVNNPSEAKFFFENGDLVPLLSFSDERLPMFPEVPTVIELGKKFSFYNQRAIVGAPGMSESAAAYYQDLFGDICRSEEWQNYMLQESLSPFWMGPDEHRPYWKTQIERLDRLLGLMGE